MKRLDLSNTAAFLHAVGHAFAMLEEVRQGLVRVRIIEDLTHIPWMELRLRAEKYIYIIYIYIDASVIP